MKSLLTLILLALGLLQGSQAMAGMDKNMARTIQKRNQSIMEKIKRMPQFSLAPGKKYNLDESTFLNEVLPDIEKSIIEAGELFGRASELLPSAEGERCVREGCDLLKKSLRQLTRAEQMLQNSGLLKDFYALIKEIKVDVKDSIRDADCDGASNPWFGKKFRSHYTNPDGKKIKGSTEISANGGVYRTDSGEGGKLERINFRNNDRVAEGLWRFQNGADGWFQFKLSDDGQSFSGNWGDGDKIGNRQRGEWKGQL